MTNLVTNITSVTIVIMVTLVTNVTIDFLLLYLTWLQMSLWSLKLPLSLGYQCS